MRVLPKPRPARTSHTRQSPGGSTWVGRAKKSQAKGSAAASRSLSLARRLLRVSSGKLRKELANDCICVNVAYLFAFAGQIKFLLWRSKQVIAQPLARRWVAALGLLDRLLYNLAPVGKRNS